MIAQRSTWMRTLLPAWILLLNPFAQTNHLANHLADHLADHLEVGQSLTRELIGSAAHVYNIALTPNQYAHWIVTQRGIDVRLTLISPDGKTLLEVDEYDDEEDEPEMMYWLAESAGTYRMEIRPREKDATAGRYEIKLAVLRPATAQDRQRVAAEQAMIAAGKLFDEDSTESYRQARQHYETAASLFHALPDFSQEASAQFHLGLIANKLNEKARAIEHFQTAQRLRHDLRDRAGEGAAWQNIGAIYSDLGDKRKALEAYLQALPLRREAKDRNGEAITLNSLGVIYRDLGERQKAEQHYLLSLRLRRELKDRNGEAITLNNLAVLYDDWGETQKMLDTYAQALPLRRDARGRAITLTNLGRGYDRLGLVQEALSYYAQALPLTRSAGDKLWEARTLNYMGLAYWAQGEYTTALAQFNEALPLYRTTKNHVGEAATLNNIGLVYDAVQQPREALTAYQQALALQREAKDRQYEAHVLNNLGFVYERLGDKVRAREQHERALELSHAVSDRHREAKVRYGLARLDRDSGNLKRAQAHIEQALALVETMRAKLDSPDLRAAYRASTAQYYEFYVDLLMRQRRQADGKRFVELALQASEQARARSLLELLNEVGANLRSDAAPELVARERELQQQLTDQAAQQIKLLNGSYTPEQATAAATAVDTAATALRDVQAELRRANPRYAGLTQPQPITLSALQKMLDFNTLLLEYSLGEERSYLWAVTHDSITSYELPPRADLERVARKFYEFLTNPKQQAVRRKRGLQIANTDGETFAQTAATLSHILIGPVATRLAQKRLLVVADGALQFVPFGVLPEPVVGGRWSVVGKKQNQPPVTSHQPLIVKHEILIVPSASTLVVQRQLLKARPAAPKPILVLADPVFEAGDERVQKGDAKAFARKSETLEIRGLAVKQAAVETGIATGGLSVPRLPGTRQEAERILGFVPTEQRAQALDFQASRATLDRAELSQYRIVHFATHGFLNSVRPELSGLVLSLVNEKGEAQNDGFLFAHEVYNLNLRADLVTLSACQTGLGKEVRGEGVVGLTRGLLYAGAARVVVSLWNVDDDATSELMTRFYRGMLQRGLRPAAALRAAQIEMWKQGRRPYFWAAFGLHGEWR